MVRKMVFTFRLGLSLVLSGSFVFPNFTPDLALACDRPSCLAMTDHSMFVPCAIYKGIGFEFTLRRDGNPIDPVNGVWRMDTDSLQISRRHPACPSASSCESCVNFSNNLDMVIPCAIFEGVEYALRLNFNREGLYWNMVRDQPKTIYQAGMAWDPEYAGGRMPVPVVWKGVDTPSRLPMLNLIGNCEGAGSVQGMTIVEGQPVMVGIANVCFSGDDGDSQSMKPVIWQNGTITILERSYDTSEEYGTVGHVLGLANDVAYKDGALFVVGATGNTSPRPIFWLNGYPMKLPLPEGYDAGEARTIRIDGDDIYVSALISGGDPGSMTFAAGYWKIDADLTDADWTFLPLPEGAQRPNAPVPLAASESTVWGIVNAHSSDDPKFTKPALVRNGDAPVPLIDFDFDREPYGLAYDLLWNGMRTIAAGSVLSGEYGYPAPVQWNGQEIVRLSTADDSLCIGIGHSVVMSGSDVFVSGGTYRRDAEDPEWIVEVPCYWKNGVRYDRQGFPATGVSSIEMDPPKVSDIFHWGGAWPVIPQLSTLPQGPLGVSGSEAAVALAIAIKVQ